MGVVARQPAAILVGSKRATVKAGTQERGTELGTEPGMEVMWFHTGNYTEMMPEV